MMQRTLPEQPAPARLGYIAHEQSVGFILGFVAGFVDVASYLALFGLFSANMTGNIVLAAVALEQPHGSITVSRLIAIPVFMLGVFVGWAIEVFAKRRTWSVPFVLLVSEAVMLLAFLSVGLVYAPLLQSGSQQLLILGVGFFALIAMGMQNAIGRSLFSDLPATTVMTTNLSLFVLDVAGLISRVSRKPEATSASSQQRYARAVAVLFGFVLGAVAGAYGTRYLSYWGIALPILLLLLLAVAMRESTKERLG